MFLKSLELNGFKSFAQKTTLEFPKGITSIVGPNGSGKSNIIDAIRWLLGEREAKNLRGSKVENLIFAGTPKKPRVAMAQVALFFDNSSGFFPTDFSEVSVMRRVSRDGNSQYFINKSEVRLKDVVDFFARARLGTKGLAIINQGSSDLFVRVSPEERRVMIEEVLGLREFQLKKSEAERKLENTNFNLEKVKAMVEEVLPRLRMLKRQTAKWEKRSEVEKELNELENNYFSFKIFEIKKEKEKINVIEKDLEIKIGERGKELKILEGEVERIEKRPEQKSFSEINIQKKEFLNKQLNIQKEISRLEAKLEFLSEQKETEEIDFKKDELFIFLKDVKGELEKAIAFSEKGEIIEATKRLIEKIERFLNSKSGKTSERKPQIEEIAKLKEELSKEINIIEGELKKLENLELETTLRLEDFNKRFQKAYEAVEAKKGEISSLESQRQKIIFEREKYDLKFSDIEAQLLQIGRKAEEFYNIKPESGSHDWFETERRMFKLRAEMANIGEIDESLLKEAGETEKHYNFLSTQIADLEKASEDLKVLIKDLRDKIHSEFEGAIHSINEKFNEFFKLMFEGGHAKIKIKKYELRIKNNNENGEEGESDKTEEETEEEKIGIDIEVSLPRKKITSLEMLSGGEKSLVSIAALFALISVSPPPFLVLDEIDAPLDEKNSQRFANLIKEFAYQTQFIIVTHNRAVMEVADVLYGVTMNDDGTSRVLSLKFEESVAVKTV